jgi:hypothetical protein
VSVLVGVIVITLVVLAVVEARHYLTPKSTATTKPTLPAGPAPKPYTIDGTVTRPAAAAGGQADAGTVTIIAYLPAWSTERQQDWEKRVNEKVAQAWQQGGGNGDTPPKVSADPVSVRRADEAIAKRLRAAKSATPWKHQCTTEYLALLKENPVEAGRTTAAADGTFSLAVPRPGADPYVIYATGGGAEWLDVQRRGSNHMDLNDSNRVPD